MKLMTSSPWHNDNFTSIPDHELRHIGHTQKIKGRFVKLIASNISFIHGILASTYKSRADRALHGPDSHCAMAMLYRTKAAWVGGVATS
jgi:hypothetical protein